MILRSMVRKQDREGGRKASKRCMNAQVIGEGVGPSPTGDFIKSNVEHTSELSYRGWGG